MNWIAVYCVLGSASFVTLFAESVVYSTRNPQGYYVRQARRIWIELALTVLFFALAAGLGIPR
jgi:hypothetical protein